jgi:hypothetical protein
MSTSLLYHACGVRGYQLRRSDFVLGRVCFWVEQPLFPSPVPSNVFRVIPPTEHLPSLHVPKVEQSTD